MVMMGRGRGGVGVVGGWLAEVIIICMYLFVSYCDIAGCGERG